MTTCKTDSQWEAAVKHREPSSALSDNLEGWDGVGGGRKVQEGGEMCIPTADSCCYMAETNTRL